MKSDKLNDTNYKNNDLVDLIEILKVIWNGKILILTTTLLFGIFSIYYALSIPNLYTSSTTLQLSNDNQNQNMASSQFSGLASLAGMNLSSGGDKSHYVIKTIRSREFIKHILTKIDISPDVIAAKEYNQHNKALVYDSDLFNLVNKKWVRSPTKNKSTVPSYLEVHQAVMKNFSAKIDKDSGFIVISYTHISPIFAKELLDLFIVELNEITKAKDQLESTNAIKFLENEIQKTKQKELTSSINEIISSQLKTKMFSNIKDDYLLTAIDSPYIPEVRSSPNRALICLVLTIIGGMAGIFIVVSRNFLNKT